MAYYLLLIIDAYYKERTRKDKDLYFSSQDIIYVDVK